MSNKRFKSLDYGMRTRLQELRDRCFINEKLNEERVDIFAKAVREYSHEYHTVVYDMIVANYYKKLGEQK